MKYGAFVIFILVITLMAGAASASDRVAVGAKVGTLGLGAELDIKASKFFSVGLAANLFDYDHSGEDSGINYDGTLKLESIGVLVDWYPMGGSFHVTGGLFQNDNRLQAVGVPGPGEMFDIGGETYTAAEIGSLNSAVEFDATAPYLGLGWGNPFKGGKFSFEFDLGMYKQGSPDIILSTEFSVPGLAAELAAEEAELEDDLDSYDFWPVLQAGFFWRF